MAQTLPGKRREMTTSDNRIQVIVATPYAEGSILAIARAAAEKGQLASFFTNLQLSRFGAVAAIVPGSHLRRRVQGAISRRSFSGIPSERIVTVAALMEGLHLITRRFPRSQGLSTRLMYATKRRFDRAVAMQIDSPL